MATSNQLQVRRELVGEILQAGKWRPEMVDAPLQELQQVVQTLRVEHHHFNHQPPAPRQEEAPERLPPSRQYFPVVTTQQTSKFWKGFQFAGALAMIVGTVMFAVGAPSMDEPNAPVVGFMLGLLLVPCGFIIYVIGRIGAWWYHG